MAVRFRRFAATLGLYAPRSTLLALAAWLLPAVLTAAAIQALANFLYVAAHRYDYPYDLEWMEGATLDHVVRVLEGKAIYVSPTVDFTPFIYPPLYYWVSAAVIGLFGTSLGTLRLFSVVATFGTLWFLYLNVRLRTESRLPGLIACGLFLAMFVVGGSWFDLARVDMLMMLLVSAGVYLLRRDRPLDTWAGVLFGLAFLTKQTTALMIGPLLLLRLFTGRGITRLQCGLVLSAIIAISTAVLAWTSNGWYQYYVFELPRSHGVELKDRFSFWQVDLIPQVPFAIALALYALTQPVGPWRLAERWAACIGFVGASWMLRLHAGGWLNVLLPALFFFCWMSGESLAALSEKPLEAPPRSAGAVPRADASTPARRFLAPRISVFVAAVCLAQFAVLIYPLRAHIPTKADRKANEQLIGQIKATPGPVIIPSHGHLARLAGKPPHAHQMALLDVFRGTNSRARSRLKASVRESLRSHRFSMIVLDAAWWPDDLSEHYRNMGPAFPATTTGGWTVEGTRLRPSTVYVPRVAAPPKAKADKGKRARHK